LHWRYEYVPYPSPQQIFFAHQLIDHGENLILGHHSQIVQRLERYKHGLICYSLGNFIFDHWQTRLREGILNRCKLFPDRVENVEVIPVHSDENFIVHVMDDVNKSFFLGKF
jgi:gamma-polyglutamate biosynthesis protein CapA